MSLEKWKQFYRKAWENEYDYLQIDRFAKIGYGRYNIGNCNKILIWNVLLRQSLTD